MAVFCASAFHNAVFQLVKLTDRKCPPGPAMSSAGALSLYLLSSLVPNAAWKKVWVAGCSTSLPAFPRHTTSPVMPVRVIGCSRLPLDNGDQCGLAQNNILPRFSYQGDIGFFCGCSRSAAVPYELRSCTCQRTCRAKRKTGARHHQVAVKETLNQEISSECC